MRSINRQLRAWEQEKIIERTDDRIVILREDVLTDVSEGGG